MVGKRPHPGPLPAGEGVDCFATLAMRGVGAGLKPTATVTFAKGVWVEFGELGGRKGLNERR